LAAHEVRIPLNLEASFDIVKKDGRVLRYWLKEDPACPKCGASGCKDKIINNKPNDWYRVCQRCGYEFCLIEEIRNAQDGNY